MIVSLIYLNKKEGKYFVKRFNPELSEKKVDILPNGKEFELVEVTTEMLPQLEVNFYKRTKTKWRWK